MSSESSATSVSRSKRKQRSPLENITKTCRRRVLSSSLPDISKSSYCSKTDDSTTLNMAQSGSDPCSSTDFSATQQPPLIETQGKTYSLPDLIFNAIQNQNFMTQLVPVLANAIAPSIQAAIQSAFKDLTDTIQKQSTKIESLSQKLLEAEKSNEDLQNQICNLEDTIDDLEQYGRRNSLRFHNCPVPAGDLTDINTDHIIMGICKDHLNIELSEDDISRSHPIGKPNSKGNIQIICKMKNWKIKNSVFQSKRKLKNSNVFITEDLTRFRQGIVQELTKGKRAGKVHSFWTNDGRIFAKLSEKGRKFIIRSVNELHQLAPPES